jgi:hypothetical protein
MPCKSSNDIYKMDPLKNSFFQSKKKEIEVHLHPYLMIGDREQDYFYTGDEKIDNIATKIIKDRIRKDYTYVKSILSYEYDIKKYRYDDKKNEIILTITQKSKSKRNYFNKEDLENIIDIVDPYNTGPDTWMEGNIVILSYDDLKSYGMSKKNYEKYIDQNIIELSVVVSSFCY